VLLNKVCKQRNNYGDVTHACRDRISACVLVEHALENSTLEVIVYQGQLDVICDVVGMYAIATHRDSFCYIRLQRWTNRSEPTGR